MRITIASHALLLAPVATTLVVSMTLAGAAQSSSSTMLDGFRISYVVAGEGDGALVFVHGANSSRKAWHKQMAELDIDRRLIAVDLIGSGDSDKPEADYSMELLARSIAAVMDAEQVDCATLVAHSNGVPVARQLYRLHPDRVEAIVAVDGPFRNTISPEMAQWMRDAFERPDFEEFRAQMAAMMPTFDLAEDDIDLITADLMATPKHVMEAGLDSFVDPDNWNDDPIEVPLLVLLAEQPTWTPEYVEYVETIGPRVELHTWREVSHFVMLERPEAFNALVAEFVDGLPGC